MLLVVIKEVIWKQTVRGNFSVTDVKPFFANPSQRRRAVPKGLESPATGGRQGAASETSARTGQKRRPPAVKGHIPPNYISKKRETPNTIALDKYGMTDYIFCTLIIGDSGK